MSVRNTKRSKLAVAVRAAIVATTVGATSMALVGCNLAEGDNSTSTSQTDGTTSLYRGETAPKVLVTGTVVDTNGNRLKGAVVSVAGKSATTDIYGQFRIEGVRASTVNNNGNAKLSVTVTPPKGSTHYLSAVTTVEASTVYDSNVKQGSGAALFVDGLAADTGVIALPALQSDVSGVLINRDTGEPVANTKVSLDLVQVASSFGPNVEPNGFQQLAYSHTNYVAVTDADGKFSIAGLPNDSQLKLEVGRDDNGTDWELATGVTVKTLDGRDVGVEGTATGGTGEFGDLGHVNVIDATYQDVQAPFITSVDGVYTTNGFGGVLKDSIDGVSPGLVIHFSEPVDLSRLNINNVLVSDDDSSVYLSIASIAGNTAASSSLTLALTNPLQEGQKIQISLPNTITDQANNEVINGSAISYDSVTGVGSAGDYVQLYLQAYGHAVPVTGTVALAQTVVAPVGVTNQMLYNTNAVFSDVLPGNTAVDQLNGQDVQFGSGTAAYLQSLAAAMGSSASIDTHAAGIVLTPATGASEYKLSLTRNGVPVALNAADIAIPAVSATASVSANNGVITVSYNGLQGDLYFVLNNVNVDDVLSVEALDQLGNQSGVATTLPLEDQLAPTTVLQRGYSVGAGYTGAVAGNAIGQGAGVYVQGSAASAGAPAYPVTPYMLTADAYGQNPDPLKGLYAQGPQTTSGSLLVPGAYTKAAFTNWGPVSNTLGVSFSEDLASTLAGTVGYNGSVGLTGFTPRNDVQVTNGAGMVDLVTFEAANILNFANVDNGSVLDFTNAVVDDSSNTADAADNARVIVQDRMPPFITSAVAQTDGDLVVTFNEPIDVAPAPTIYLDGIAAVYNHTDANGNYVFTKAGAGNVTTVYTTNGGNGLAELAFQNVDDSRGNDWKDYQLGTTSAGSIQAPEFLASFTGTSLSSQSNGVNNTTFVAGSTDFEVTLTFNAPVSQTTGGTTLADLISDTATVTAAGFSLAGSGVVDTSATTVSANANHTVVTVHFHLSAPLASGDVLTIPGWDGISNQWTGGGVGSTVGGTKTVQ